MKAITGAKDPDEKMAAAILTSTTAGASTISTGIVAGATQGANIMAARIIAASGGSTTPKPPPGGATSTSFTNPGVTPLAGGLTIGDPLAEMTNILNKTKNEEMFAAMQQPGTLTEEKKPSLFKPGMLNETDMRLNLPIGKIEEESKPSKLKEIFGGFSERHILRLRRPL